MNYKDILGAISAPPPSAIQAREVTDVQVLRVANKMARAGYRHTETSLEALHAYLQGFGIVLTGDVGTGKTFFFKALGVEVLNMVSLVGDSVESLRNTLAYFADREVVLDDVGAEPTANNYGVKQEYLAIILESRLKVASRTHITTNLTEEGFVQRYNDARLLDRLYEIGKPFKFEGKSQRTPRIYKA